MLFGPFKSWMESLLLLNSHCGPDLIRSIYVRLTTTRLSSKVSEMGQETSPVFGPVCLLNCPGAQENKDLGTMTAYW